MRIITRADFDGIVSAALISQFESVDDYFFCEPWEMQERRVSVTEKDIIANLAWHPAAALWFDHHISNRVQEPFNGYFRLAPSAARVVAEYYGVRQLREFNDLLTVCDRIDSADFTREQILNSDAWFHLANTIAETGSDDSAYWIKLIHQLAQPEQHDSLFADSEVAGRITEARRREDQLKAGLPGLSHVVGKVVISDFQSLPEPLTGNRFYIYALHPDVYSSVRLTPRSDGRVAISVGHNILNRKSQVNIGQLLAQYGGGGHYGAGSCRVQPEQVDQTLTAITEIINRNEPLAASRPAQEQMH